MFRLIVRVLEAGTRPTAERLWSWIKYLDRDRERDGIQPISDLLQENPRLRRDIQVLAFTDSEIEGRPWMSIVSILPELSESLQLTVEDTTSFLLELAAKDELRPTDIELWICLIRHRQFRGGVPREVAEASRWVSSSINTGRASADVGRPPDGRRAVAN